MKTLISLLAFALATPALAAPCASYAIAQPTPASGPPMRELAAPPARLEWVAYVTGRCFSLTSLEGKRDAIRFMERQEADLSEAMFKAYYKGVEDGNATPPTVRQCESQLAKAQAELASYIR
jgi:hypothetical protein